MSKVNWTCKANSNHKASGNEPPEGWGRTGLGMLLCPDCYQAYLKQREQKNKPKNKKAPKK